MLSCMVPNQAVHAVMYGTKPSSACCHVWYLPSSACCHVWYLTKQCMLSCMVPTYEHFIMTFKEILLLCIFSKETRALLNDSNNLFSYSFIYLFVKIDCSTVIA